MCVCVYVCGGYNKKMMVCVVSLFSEINVNLFL
jgi:hypothetical protein